MKLSKNTFLGMLIQFRCRPYQGQSTGSHQNSEVKRLKAWLVLRWGTAWEVHSKIVDAYFVKKYDIKLQEFINFSKFLYETSPQQTGKNIENKTNSKFNQNDQIQNQDQIKKLQNSQKLQQKQGETQISSKSQIQENEQQVKSTEDQNNLSENQYKEQQQILPNNSNEQKVLQQNINQENNQETKKISDSQISNQMINGSKNNEYIQQNELENKQIGLKSNQDQQNSSTEQQNINIEKIKSSIILKYSNQDKQQSSIIEQEQRSIIIEQQIENKNKKESLDQVKLESSLSLKNDLNINNNSQYQTTPQNENNPQTNPEKIQQLLENQISFQKQNTFLSESNEFLNSEQKLSEKNNQKQLSDQIQQKQQEQQKQKQEQQEQSIQEDQQQQQQLKKQTQLKNRMNNSNIIPKNNINIDKKQKRSISQNNKFQPRQTNHIQNLNQNQNQKKNQYKNKHRSTIQEKKEINQDNLFLLHQTYSKKISSRKYKGAIFDDVKQQGGLLNLEQFLLFCREYKINQNIKPFKLIKIFKNYAQNSLNQNLEQFLQALLEIQKIFFPIKDNLSQDQTQEKFYEFLKNEDHQNLIRPKINANKVRSITLPENTKKQSTVLKNFNKQIINDSNLQNHKKKNNTIQNKQIQIQDQKSLNQNQNNIYQNLKDDISSIYYLKNSKIMQQQNILNQQNPTSNIQTLQNSFNEQQPNITNKNKRNKTITYNQDQKENFNINYVQNQNENKKKNLNSYNINPNPTNNDDQQKRQILSDKQLFQKLQNSHPISRNDRSTTENLQSQQKIQKKTKNQKNNLNNPNNNDKNGNSFILKNAQTPKISVLKNLSKLQNFEKSPKSINKLSLKLNPTQSENGSYNQQINQQKNNIINKKNQAQSVSPFQKKYSKNFQFNNQNNFSSKLKNYEELQQQQQQQQQLNLQQKQNSVFSMNQILKTSPDNIVKEKEDIQLLKGIIDFDEEEEKLLKEKKQIEIQKSSFPIGEIYSCFLAFCFLDSLKSGNWRMLLLFSSFPSIISFTLSYLYLYESPRFLLLTAQTQEKKQEAINIMNEMAQINHQQSYFNQKINNNYQFEEINKQEQTQIINWSEQFQENVNADQKGQIKELFAQEYKKITYILMIFWFSLSFIYYGIMLQLPTILQKISDFNQNNESENQIPEKNDINSKIFGIFLSVIVEFFINMSFLVTTTFTSEIYPTSIRATGLGFHSFICRFGGILMPWISATFYLFGYSGPFLSCGIFAIFCFIASIQIKKDTQNIQLDTYTSKNIQNTTQNKCIDEL
ncbi:Major facilitator superfamily domain, general substrate transporter [Pseudocohnilembus persalinus]|uniref:Major facilitator superfamily domain, general substrate transporter n=1 Tax=Pseudocohnilembus persalinus TaxID=266149 RepID=A0A0V0QZ14_PSEPJ|nr:Major facilitator superfamily domain, general substrate transporter [Pseudocohnilembus persalinus]|eukprot:KRX07494.1 Major facilitator superfamily domain, general substrate transporter [Pseudocohnilembus persalinus]